MSDQATLNAVEDEPSMDDTILATLNSIKERDAESSEPEPANVEPVAAKPTKERSPDGKFTKAEPAKAEEINQATPENLEVAADPGAEASATEQTAAPSSWKGTAKAKFAALDPEIQQEVLRRESDFHKGVEQYKGAAQFAQTMHKAVAPFENTIRQLGVSPDVAVHALLSADHKLRFGSPADKMQSFAQMAQAYGIDLSQGLPEQQQIDPNTQYLQNQLQQTQQQLQHLTQSQQQREQSELNSQIESAKVGRPHFEEVKPHMAALLQAGLAKDLPDAYDQAIGARPDLRQELFAQQQEALRAEQVKRAQAAKQAASVNVNTRGTLRAAAPVGTMDETIAATLANIRSR